MDALGAKTELYAKLGNVGVALLLVVAFTALYNRLGSRRMISVLLALFIVPLIGLAAAFASGRPVGWVTWAFYLFGDAWTTVWVTTFRAYWNELTETEQSKRLYGLIGGAVWRGGSWVH